MLFGSLRHWPLPPRVVLPYDEAFVGTAEGLLAINPRLLAFMAHDRISLAGTMVAIGDVPRTSIFGIRRGLHWARQAVFYSAHGMDLLLFLDSDTLTPSTRS
jgi:hypothetical protein